jgi:uncharacterized protein (DUF2235 family)
MKRLVVCADGTWNDEDRLCTPTNVARLHRALQTRHIENVPQLVYYHSGVGTKWGELLSGGAFGVGINRTILACYRFLVDHYEPGDALYFFGFSRGAYTVRSLAGLVRNSGIVKDAARVHEAFALYRDREADPGSERALCFRREHAHPGPDRPELVQEDRDALLHCPDIEFVGVWDTVGSLGYPLPFFELWKRVLPRFGINWWFHDTMLSKSVLHAYHAMAIHERRSDFPVTRWTQALDAEGRPSRPRQVLEQVWFPGVHCDVGGGYGSSGLSDLALQWMVDKARKCGLLFRDRAIEVGVHIAPDPLGRQHESFTGLFLVGDMLRGRPRGAPRAFGQGQDARESIAQSALTRYLEMAGADWPEAQHGFADQFERMRKPPSAIHAVANVREKVG